MLGELAQNGLRLTVGKSGSGILDVALPCLNGVSNFKTVQSVRLDVVRSGKLSSLRKRRNYVQRFASRDHKVRHCVVNDGEEAEDTVIDLSEYSRHLITDTEENNWLRLLSERVAEKSSPRCHRVVSPCKCPREQAIATRHVLQMRELRVVDVPSS